MQEPLKRILTIIGFILSVIVIAFGIYFAFFRAQPLPGEGTPTSEEGAIGELPNAGEGAPSVTEEGTAVTGGLQEADQTARGGVTVTTELTQSSVFNTALAGDGKSMNFYDESDGKFYSIDSKGNVKALSEKQFPSVEKATWNKDAQKAILEFPDGSNVVYDFDAETQVTLPKHWEDFDFSPTTDELAAKSLGLDPDNRWLVLSNADGSNVKSIQALGDNESKVQVNWSPNDQVVAFSDTAEGQGSFDRKLIVPLGKNHENFKGLEVEGLGFSSQWSPDGKQLLYSVSGSYSNYRPLLWIVDGTSASMGKNRKSLSVNTWVEKCSFASSDTIFCAVPRDLPPNAGFQPAAFNDLSDSLYKIDLATGTSTLIAIPEGDKTMSNLFVTEDQSLLYYTNTISGRLEYIKLK
ncbi:hypothetical protein HY771_03480 [Candidatus Uhrbacteria bacterium]|nr:hypothetical protein [Candidatus Uhrbacteria bacterium]